MSQGPDDLSNLDQPSIEDGPAKAVIQHEEALAKLAEHPDDIDAITNQAKAMVSMGGGGYARCLLTEAAELCKSRDAQWISIRLQTARLCHNEGLAEEALELLEGLERISDPKTGNAVLMLRGRCLLRAGRFDETRKTIGDMVRLGKFGNAAQTMIAEVDAAEGNHDRARSRLEQLLKSKEVSDAARAPMEFLLATSLDRIGDHDAAFEAARRANDILAPEFDAAEFEAETDRLLKWSTPERIRSLPLSSDRETRSIFIVGMPRSGTSLLEQIISAHPMGEGIGERFEFNMFQALLAHRTGLPHPECIEAGDTSIFDEFAAAYRTMEKSIAPTASRVTNKALGLDLHLPLISRVLPGSRAILLQRSPLDNLVSIFMNPINPESLPWSCSMEGLIAGRRRFDRLTEHWHEVLEIETLPLRYEDLVDDPEARIREVLEFLEIEFDESSVDFHKSSRVVMTPSWSQVNRPMNRDAVDRWRRYERHIGPLIEAFGE